VSVDIVTVMVQILASKRRVTWNWAIVS